MASANIGSAALLLLLILSAGCKDQAATPSNAPNAKPVVASGAEHGHSHERGKMLLADVGRKYHALLTAHLSPKGNELDVFFETQDDKNPRPAAIRVESLTAVVNVAGSDQTKDLKFEPAPPDERPKDEKPGFCSHFVANAAWLKPNDVMTVVIFLKVDDERYRISWENFIPKKYAHHEE